MMSAKCLIFNFCSKLNEKSTSFIIKIIFLNPILFLLHCKVVKSGALFWVVVTELSFKLYYRKGSEYLLSWGLGHLSPVPGYQA
jgi:hypothetical protein